MWPAIVFEDDGNGKGRTAFEAKESHAWLLMLLYQVRQWVLIQYDSIKSFLIHARILTGGFDDDLAVGKTGYVNIPGTDSHYPPLSCFHPLASGFTMFYPLKFPPPFGPLRWLSCGLSFSLDRHFAWETADTQTDTLQFTTSNDQHSHCQIWQVVIRCVETFEVQLSHSTEAISLEFGGSKTCIIYPSNLSWLLDMTISAIIRRCTVQHVTWPGDKTRNPVCILTGWDV